MTPITALSTFVKGHHPLNLLRRAWTRRDRLLATQFPQRKATLLPAVWVEELMAKRFGALIICGACAVQYRDGISRWGYARHPDMKAQGNACDFCKRVDPYPTALWLKEEHQYPTLTEHAHQQAHAVAPWPSSFRGDVFTRRAACIR